MEESSDGRRLSRTVCLLCRQRKIRCDRNLPGCESCIKLKADCQYVRVKNKPGLRAGYVSELEQRLAKLEKEVQAIKVDRASKERAGLEEVLFRLRHSGEEPPSDIQDAMQSSSPTQSFVAAVEDTVGASPKTARYSPPVFDPLAKGVIDELCTTWFQKYHAWFPILHQPSLLEVLQTSSDLSTTMYSIVFRAIAVVAIPHWGQTAALTSEQRHKLSDDLRGQIVMESISHLSLQSLQAVLMLTIRDWGLGRLIEFWNLVALAKRMGTQLGLRDLVANHCDNYNQLSSLPPRMLPLPNSLVNKEEKIRAYWMTEVLDCSSTVGAAWNVNISKPENTGLLPCSDIMWAFPEAIISAWSFGDFETPSTYSLYVMLVTNELYHVHQFLQQSFDTQSVTERIRQQQECKTIDERLIGWRSRFAVASLRMSVENSGSYDANVVLTQCTLDLSIISLYQRLAFLPSSVGDDQGPWYHAIQRCLDACDGITNTLRGTHDMNLESISPLIISSIIVSSRFLLGKVPIFPLPR
ncbi:hypothetical protein K491DRAFT_691794 [Lophiostoma macrostomum CBS 122681]|uniref:Zn(2)-C6 fungal-type domain-containing protein n=1 Tax=Lophiostoma macrostomum CBS 122681 TaxID=1314788 RepID=A0A6A6T9X4_9PLEO|nr:hypothetical protein K491DRAFT_691794 [Lophiostoma macrostomum CBS 122681]